MWIMWTNEQNVFGDNENEIEEENHFGPSRNDQNEDKKKTIFGSSEKQWKNSRQHFFC